MVTNRSADMIVVTFILQWNHCGLATVSDAHTVAPADFYTSAYMHVRLPKWVICMHVEHMLLLSIYPFIQCSER